MEENFIYDDLVNEGDLGATIHDLQIRNNELQSHVTSLEQDIQKLCNKISEMQKVQDSLSKNISSLYNTAKNELERKDRRIDELQTRLDEMIFRRRNPNPGFKRKWEDSHSDEMNKRPCIESEVSEIQKSTENSGQISYKDKICGGVKEKNRSNIDKEPDSNRLTFKQNDKSSYKESSREDSHKRDTRESQRDRRDSYRDNYRDRGRDVRTDERDKRRDHRDNYRDSRENNRSYRDRSRARNEDLKSNRDDRKNSGDSRSNRRSDREPHMEHRGRQRSDQNKNQHENMKQKSNNECISHIGEVQKEKDQQSHSVCPTEKIETVKNPHRIEDDSKEEGELSDEEPPKQKTFKHEKTKMDVDENPSLDHEKSFNVYKFIEEQQKRNTLKKSMNAPGALEMNNDKVKTIEANIEKLKENHDVNIKNNRISVKKKVKTVIVDNVEEKSLKKEYNAESSANKNHKYQHTEKTNETGNSNVNIISDIVLSEGNQNQPFPSASEPHLKQTKTNEYKVEKKTVEPPKNISNIDKRKRESRVPRNLTDELNINLDRTKTRQELISKLFGSAEKRSPMYNLSDEGEIPNLKLFSDPDPSEIMKNNVEGANPVTEFQIFKSNLPCLEKSNSLSSISVQIQTPPKEEKETSRNYSSHKEKVATEGDKNPNFNLENTEDKKNSEHSKRDISLDMLNIDIKQYKVEDFPNMTAYSDSTVDLDSQLKPSKIEDGASVEKLAQIEKGDSVHTNIMNFNRNLSETLREDRKEFQQQKELLDKYPQNCSTPKISSLNILHSSSDNCNVTPNLSSETDDDLQLNYSIQATYPLLTPIKDSDLSALDKLEEDADIEIGNSKKQQSESSIKKSDSPSESTVTGNPIYQNEIHCISSGEHKMNDKHQNALDLITCSNSKNVVSPEVTMQNSPKKLINFDEGRNSAEVGKTVNNFAFNSSKKPLTRGCKKPKDNADNQMEAQNCMKSKNSRSNIQISQQKESKENSEGLQNHIEMKAPNLTKNANSISYVESEITSNEVQSRAEKTIVSRPKNQPPVPISPISKISSKKIATLKVIEKNSIDENSKTKTLETEKSRTESTQKKSDQMINEVNLKDTATKSPNNLKRRRRCTLKIL